MEPIEVKWEVEDGYAGKSRPQTTIVDIEKHHMPASEWDELSQEEKEFVIYEAVQEDFDQKISFGIYDFGF